MKKFIILFLITYSLSKQEKNKTEIVENLKIVKPKSESKKVKRDLQSSKNNPLECYLTFHTFPLQYFIEAERVILRLRFFSNCYPAKDLVLMSNLVLGGADFSVDLSTILFGDTYEFHFSNAETENSSIQFSKMNYKTAQITRNHEMVEMPTYEDNNMIVKYIMSDLDIDVYERFNSLATCGTNGRKIMCMAYNLSNSD